MPAAGRSWAEVRQGNQSERAGRTQAVRTQAVRVGHMRAVAAQPAAGATPPLGEVPARSWVVLGRAEVRSTLPAEAAEALAVPEVATVRPVPLLRRASRSSAAGARVAHRRSNRVTYSFPATIAR